MPLHARRPSFASIDTTTSSSFSIPIPQHHNDLRFPFGRLDGLDAEDLFTAAYEIFFTGCRSSPGLGSNRNSSQPGSNLNTYPSSSAMHSHAHAHAHDGGAHHERSLVGASRVKRALGLRSMRRLSFKKVSSPSLNPASPKHNGGGSVSSPRGGSGSMGSPRIKRPMTSAEIMRQQMRVSELSDNRLRKTLLRTLVGQMGRRAETIILPLELLRHLKPSEFANAQEYHLWQTRQLKILEAGLVRYPSIPLEKSNTFAQKLSALAQESETKPIDTGKNSEAMRTLCNSVISLSWRSANGTPADCCHWADGFPLNINLYVTLLYSVFDHKDETLVLDEVDELLELLKKTWSTLGINKMIHNVCFMWVLFNQYVATGQIEQDLLCASLAMLSEVANDVRKSDREVTYMKILSSVLASIEDWSEKRLLDYRESFHRGTAGLMESLLPLALSTARIIGEDISNFSVVNQKEDLAVDRVGNRADYYIKTSMRSAFDKIYENVTNSTDTAGERDMSEVLIQLATEIEEIANEEKDNFSPILKKWHPIAAGVAALTLHGCFGAVLKQYLAGVSTLKHEAINVLQRAGKLEKELVRMVAEDSVDCEEVGKAIIREMVPYESEAIILKLVKTWLDEKFRSLRECIERAKETETWHPKSKTEPFAHSAAEIVNVATEIVGHFFEIPIDISEDLVHHLADGLDRLFRDYASFVASCGSKQSYIPALPPLTRCHHDSRFLQLWRKTYSCRVGVEENRRGGMTDASHLRPSTSRGTQRLYIRLNTLHYIFSHLHSLDKSLSLSPRQNSSVCDHTADNGLCFVPSTSYFKHAQSSILAATQHVSEVVAYRLIFQDSNFVFYDSLYIGDVANSRIRPAIHVLKQNITLLYAVVTDRAQPIAMKEVMKASFKAFLMVLLAGGSRRVFTRSDYEMIVEDFDSLKRVFCTSGEGLLPEEVVEKEAETVEGVVGLMGQSTEQLLEEFSIVTYEVSGLGVVAANGHKLPMPSTTGRWIKTDPNTILRVLCHRDDRVANHFLKRNFQLASRR